MLIEAVLDKIVDHNVDVQACILASGDNVYHNLSGAYEVVDPKAISDRALNMLAITELLEDEQCEAGTAFVEYDDHSLMVKSLNDDDTLILINGHMARAGFKKLQIGINLFIKPLERAKAEAARAAREAIPLVAERENSVKHGLAAPREEEAQKVETAAEPVVPPSPDGNPEHAGKKKRIYRGVVFWE